MKKHRLLLPLFLILISLFSWAEDGPNSNEELLKRWKKHMETNQEEFNKFFKGFDFKNIEKELKNMEKLLEEFHKGSRGNDVWKGLFDRMDSFREPQLGNFYWKETYKERILVLEVKLEKDSPLDIKVENYQVKISGKAIVEQAQEKKGKSYSSKEVISFNRVFSIPRDVDSTKEKIEVKDNKIYIRFPKKIPSVPEKKSPNKDLKKERKQIKPTKDGISI